MGSMQRSTKNSNIIKQDIHSTYIDEQSLFYFHQYLKIINLELSIDYKVCEKLENLKIIIIFYVLKIKNLINDKNYNFCRVFVTILCIMNIFIVILLVVRICRQIFHWFTYISKKEFLN